MYCPNCNNQMNNRGNHYVCPYCGTRMGNPQMHRHPQQHGHQQNHQYAPQQEPPISGGARFGWGLLGFLIPLVGFILFLAWKKDYRKKAKSAGIGALIGFILHIIIVILVVVVTLAFIEGLLDALFGAFGGGGEQSTANFVLNTLPSLLRLM